MAQDPRITYPDLKKLAKARKGVGSDEVMVEDPKTFDPIDASPTLLDPDLTSNVVTKINLPGAEEVRLSAAAKVDDKTAEPVQELVDESPKPKAKPAPKRTLPKANPAVFRSPSKPTTFEKR